MKKNVQGFDDLQAQPQQQGYPMQHQQQGYPGAPGQGYPDQPQGYYGQPPVLQQPVQQTTVVVNQPQAVQQRVKTWSSGTCDCFNDCNICECGPVLGGSGVLVFREHFIHG